jgi:nicotinamidase/pyrazinamidase
MTSESDESQFELSLSESDLSGESDEDLMQSVMNESNRKLPKKSPENSPRRSHKKSPENSPKKSPKRSYKKSPRNSPKKSPKNSPKKSPKNSPKKSPKNYTNESPENSQKKSPKKSYRKSPENSPKKSPENSPNKSPEKKSSRAVLIMDPQNDFYPAKSNVRKKGAMSVPGANKDMERLLSYLKINEPTAMFVSQDTHQHYDIGHPSFWVDDRGEHPQPYTRITSNDIEEEKWMPLSGKLDDYIKKYGQKIKKGNRQNLTIWPYHAIDATKGHEIVDELRDYIRMWEEKTGKTVTYVRKGENPYTVFYSMFKADIPLKKDRKTELNHELINKLKKYDTLVVSGQALSHCVNHSVRDLVDNWPRRRRKDIVLLKNTCSAVPGFDKESMDFIKFAEKSGITINTA